MAADDAPEPSVPVTAVAPPVIGVCEDDDQLREILRVALEREGMSVRATASGRDAVTSFPQLGLSAIVLDIGLPDSDGRDVCQALRARGVDTPILFLTARDVLADRLSGFHAGGDDYLTKPFAIAELVLRIRALVRRADPTAPAGATESKGALVLDPAAHAIVVGAERVDLTPTEFRLLAALAARPGSVLRRGELLAAGWPDGAKVSENTLDSYLARIRRKLESARARGAIDTVRGVGYALR